MTWLIGDGFDFYATATITGTSDMFTGPVPLWVYGDLQAMCPAAQGLA
jgi:hypothetical protein